MAEKKPEDTRMDYSQRQQEVERVRLTLMQGWDGSTAVLRQHVAGKPEEVRRDVYAFYWRLGTTSKEPRKRASVVEFMLDEVVEETAALRGQLLKWLEDFRQEDFDARARLTLSRLPWTEDYCPAAIRLIGIAELTEVAPRLKAEISDHALPVPPPPRYETTNTWTALLALSRLGDQAALATVLQRVEHEEDIILRATVLFYDLGYTRRPAAFDMLKRYLNSAERLPRIKDNVPGRLEASHAAAVFAKYIQGFPIEETDFDEHQVRQARIWVNAQGSWKFK